MRDTNQTAEREREAKVEIKNKIETARLRDMSHQFFVFGSNRRVAYRIPAVFWGRHSNWLFVVRYQLWRLLAQATIGQSALFISRQTSSIAGAQVVNRPLSARATPPSTRHQTIFSMPSCARVGVYKFQNTIKKRNSAFTRLYTYRSPRSTTEILCRLVYYYIWRRKAKEPYRFVSIV